MTHATMSREFNPGRSPLLGLVAVIAAALTMGATVLLPAAKAPSNVPVAVSAVSAAAPETTQIVKLPAVEVVGTLRDQGRRQEPLTLPASFKKG